MRNIGSLAVGGRSVQVTLLEQTDLMPIPLDARVSSLAAWMRSGVIIVCEIPLIAFFSEKENGDRARIRKLIAQAADQTGWILKFNFLADSIEDVAIAELTSVPDYLSTIDFTVPATLFFPTQYLGLLDVTGGGQLRLIVSSAWKTNTIDVFDLDSRFEDELANWRMYDYPSLVTAPQDDARNALAAALGVKESFDRIKEQYLYGYEIGEAVGKEHINQCLAMDLKLEHFIWSTVGADFKKDVRGHVWHVDHEHDVMLFREPTVEECAKSIAPLYLQMDYPLWHAFREGYWDTRRREALDVLVIFDGWLVGEILGVQAVRNAVKARNAEQWQDALNWCDDAQIALNAFREADDTAGSFYLARLKLVRGDIFFQSGRFEEALAQYDEARNELNLLKVQRVSSAFEVTSALINSAGALTQLGRRPEARERLLQAKMLAAQLPSDNPQAQFLGDAIRKNLVYFDD